MHCVSSSIMYRNHIILLGFIPSLVLVTNPAINYTIFDRLKLHVMAMKIKATPQYVGSYARYIYIYIYLM